MTTVLLGKISIEDAVQRYARSIDALASGVIPHNPGQLLGSSAMASLLVQVSKSYDFVVIDMLLHCWRPRTLSDSPTPRTERSWWCATNRPDVSRSPRPSAR